jgi:hypothetical protein
MQETSEGKINLSEDEPATVKLLMRHLYEGEYEPYLPNDNVTSDTLKDETQLEILRTLEYDDQYGCDY